MSIIINIDVMMAKRKMSLGELAERVDITPANLSILKNGKAKAELVFKLWWPAVWVLMANLWACGLVGWPVFLGLLTFPLYWRACRLVHEAVEWLDLDQHGHLVRKLYLINGALLIAGVVLK